MKKKMLSILKNQLKEKTKCEQQNINNFALCF